MVGTILWALIGGTIIGFLGKTFAPGKRDIALWLTILCGIGGVLLGNWLYIDVFDFQREHRAASTGGATSGRSRWRRSWSCCVTGTASGASAPDADRPDGGSGS